MLALLLFLCNDFPVEGRVLESPVGLMHNISSIIITKDY